MQLNIKIRDMVLANEPLKNYAFVNEENIVLSVSKSKYSDISKCDFCEHKEITDEDYNFYLSGEYWVYSYVDDTIVGVEGTER